MGPYRFCSGGTLYKPSWGYRFGYRFRVGPYRFCSNGNPTTLTTLLWSYLILSDTHMNNPVKTRRLILSFGYSSLMPQRTPTQKISPLKTALIPKPFAKLLQYPGFLGVFRPQFFCTSLSSPQPHGTIRTYRRQRRARLVTRSERGRSPYFSRFSPPYYIFLLAKNPLHVGIWFTLERIRIFCIFCIFPSLLALDFQDEASLSRWAKSKRLCQCQKRRGVVY